MAADNVSSNKFRKLSDNPTSLGYDESVKKALEELDVCQNEIDLVNEKSSEEILQVEQKYSKVRKPMFKRRENVISCIPSFWYTAFMNHIDLNVIVDESEEDCLHHMSRIEVEEFDDIKTGFVLKFYFEENPYFHNTILTKEYHLGSSNPTSRSSVINWKEGCALVPSSNETPVKGRKRKLESKSFFSWFNDNSDPLSDDVAEYIKDDLWQNPLQYFLVPDAENDNVLEEEESDSSLEGVTDENRIFN